MKYPQLVSMPSAISDWLEEQLEARGIDAVVYTRYVLSLLYRDPADIICDQDQDVRPGGGGGGGGGRKRLCRASYYAHHHWAHADAERLQRSAAVECLKSASDQKCGIESLVDELCAKLKELQQRKLSAEVVPDVEHHHHHQQQQQARSHHHQSHHARSKPVRIPRKHAAAERDSARRYYAAFPALTATSGSGSAQLVHIVPKWLGSPKRRLVARKAAPPPPASSQDMEIKPPPALSKYRKHKPKTTGGGLKAVAVHQMAAPDGRGAQHAADDDDEMYDLPLLDDIRELLDSVSSPPPMDAALLQAAAASPAPTSGKFLPCGTNIISSIWSASEGRAGDGGGGGGGCGGGYGLDAKFGGVEAAALWATWADRDFERDHRVAQSLLKLNHARDASGFIEVQPRLRHLGLAAPAVAPAQHRPADEDDGKDDLLHSARSHFKPISEAYPLTEEAQRQPRYVDGTTFAIHANLDVVAFERSASGTMYLQEVVGSAGSKRYLEYKREHAFNVKFNVNPNDKSCQTDDCSGAGGELLPPPPQALPPADQRPDSTMAELFSEADKCANCASAISSSASATSENIWNGEICMGCLQLAAFASERITPLQERQLREDIQEDGERLLSDLSSLQRSYIDEHEGGEPEDVGELLPPSEEATYDIAALICAPALGGGGGGGVRKLRVPIHSASFSFATRLQQDCLLKMATIPTLRSVTL